jgi:hypothetical protein
MAAREQCWQDIRKLLTLNKWRTDRDSNPGYLAVYTLSKRAPSATRPSVRTVALGNFLTLSHGGRGAYIHVEAKDGRDAMSDNTYSV